MASSVESQLLNLLGAVIGKSERPVALHEPCFKGKEWDYVKECLDSGWVSSVGSYVERFEAQLASITGAKHAVAVVNGTAALHIALKVCGVKSDDEVIVPALTFVATANAVVHCGAVPHFVDCEQASLGVCIQTLDDHLKTTCEYTSNGIRNRETGRRIAAIAPMHVFGHACDMVELIELADKWNLPVVEDAAEAIGSYFNGRHLGTWGKVGIISFNGNKLVTTGGGGAILTDCREIATYAKHLTTTAKIQHRWEFVHDEVAYNYRMPNLNAALGCAQLEGLTDLVHQKRILAHAYLNAMEDLEFIRGVPEPKGCRSNYWLNAVRIVNGSVSERDAALAAANDAGFQCRPLWRPMHLLKMFANCPRSELTVTNQLSDTIINVPSSPVLARII
jgi:perosamine synthetase